ncbi:MAG: hypothetical protein N2C13_05755 [Chloroflexota bacterium]
MEQKVINSISSKVSKKFPEVSGKKPSVKRRPVAKSQTAAETFLLIFKGMAVGPGGKSIPRQVRVVANAKGKIIKMTTSK